MAAERHYQRQMNQREKVNMRKAEIQGKTWSEAMMTKQEKEEVRHAKQVLRENEDLKAQQLNMLIRHQHQETQVKREMSMLDKQNKARMMI